VGQDQLYYGKGKGKYKGDKLDCASSSCEEDKLVNTGGPSLILLACVAVLSCLCVMMCYVIGRDS
jgi:hypothetical protein